jgi:lysophospholipid acyltransferase (LPLAT)-like uncharacterized protein
VGAGARKKGPPEEDWRIPPLSRTLAALIRALAATVDFRFHDEAPIRAWEAEGRPFILAFWHRHLLLMPFAYRGGRMTVLVSQSWDGELTSQALAHLGLATSRGSTSRGGTAALRDLLRRARAGSDLGFTPDGPRGPLRKVQPGVVVAAALTAFPVIPVAIGASRRKLLRSWDRMLVPLPGARVEVVYGTPLTFASRAPLAEGVERLEQALLATESRAEELAQGAPGSGGIE